MSEPRYRAIMRLAQGGMATVWIGAVSGALGFRQLVAIKKPHPHVLAMPDYKAELMAEARLASMIQHGNVVDVRDVAIEDNELILVMDYIEGASLRELLVAAKKRGQPLAPGIAVRILLDTAAGLHAAHELVDERGRPTELIHRDVSPQNILVGLDGISRITDFGVAKFTRKYMEETETGTFKGKFAYMAPEYLNEQPIDRRLDVFALGVVLWEAIANERCFQGESEIQTFGLVLEHEPRALSKMRPGLGTALDEIAQTALAKDPAQRFASAVAFARALESAARESDLLATHADVAAAMRELFGAVIEERRVQIRETLANEPSLQSLVAVPAVPPPVLETAAMPAVAAAAPPAAPAKTLVMAAPSPPARAPWLLPALGGAVVALIAATAAVSLTTRTSAPAPVESAAPPVVASVAPVVVAPAIAPAASTVVTSAALVPPPRPPVEPAPEPRPRAVPAPATPSAKPKKSVLPNPYQ